MFEVGFSEIVLIVGLALLVLGPEKLPGLVNKVGHWTGRARSMARQLRSQLEQEVNLDELSKSHPMQGGPPAQSRTPQSGQQSDGYPVYPLPEQDSPHSIDETPPGAQASDITAVRPDGAPTVDLSKPPQ